MLTVKYPTELMLRLLASACLFVLLSACALTDMPATPPPAATVTVTATPETPTATPTLVLQRSATATLAAASRTTPLPPVRLGGRTLCEQPVGEFVGSDVALSSFKATADRKHYVYLNAGTSGASIVWDGRPGKTYTQVDALTLHLSTDGLHAGYAAFDGQQWLIVKDEQEIYRGDRHLLFNMSRDGQHVAYSLGRGDSAIMAVDGQPGKPYDLLGTPTFSPDGRHVAYLGFTQESGQPVVRMVRDGQEGKAYADINLQTIVFSPDSQHLAYIATTRDGETVKQFVVLDGVEQKPYQQVEQLSVHFSPDSRRLAYAAKLNDQWLIVVDGQESTPWEKACTCISFSPDSRRLAYQGETRSAWYPVIDGKPGQAYGGLLFMTPFFSPDSQHTALAGLTQTGWAVVVDGKDLSADRYDVVLPTSLVFGPDSRRVGYAARRGGQWSVYGDGQSGQLYTYILSGPAFIAPDTMAYLALRDSTILYVEDTLAHVAANTLSGSTPSAQHPGVPLPDTFKYAKDFDAKGYGPISFAPGDYPIFHYRPNDNPKLIEFVKTLMLHVMLAKTSGSPAPTLDFGLWVPENDGWTSNGGRNHFSWGSNDIDLRFPDQNVSRKGDIYFGIRNYGQQKIDVKSINFTMVVKNADGTETTYQPQ